MSILQVVPEGCLCLPGIGKILNPSLRRSGQVTVVLILFATSVLSIWLHDHHRVPRPVSPVFNDSVLAHAVQVTSLLSDDFRGGALS